MTLRQQQSQFAQHVALLIQYIWSQGYTCTLGEAYRTPEQSRLNASRGIGIANSLHTQRLAIDLNIFDKNGTFLTDSKDYTFAGEYWESLDKANVWGGRWKKLVDGNHYERRPIKL